MPAIDVVDSTWFPARPSTVAALMADPSNWRRWWPGLSLDVDEWRGDRGVRWLVPSASGIAAGLHGSAEVWLEPMFEGVVAHFFLRLDPADGARLSARTREKVTDAYRRQTKQIFWALADQLDTSRVARHTGDVVTTDASSREERATGRPGSL